MDLAKRSISSALWQIPPGLLQIILPFLSSIYLARWLDINIFGDYALASSIVVMTSTLMGFGMHSALVHRAEETIDENIAANVHFSLKLFISIGWIILFFILTFILATDELFIPLVVIGSSHFVHSITETHRLILIRRVVHKRLSIIQLISIIVSTPVMLLFALNGFGIWSLLIGNVIGAAIELYIMYFWKPFWKPKLLFDRKIIGYLIKFGAKVYPTMLLSDSLDRVDDVWVGFFLGNNAMGYYSRAYRFATYPRRLLASPISSIAGGMYAELKNNREKLSRAFMTVNAILLRSGFVLSGILWLVAPEFIRIFIGSKWMPMLNTFRLMIVFTMLDPIKLTLGNLLVYAVGKPELVLRVRFIQLFIMIVGIFTLGSAYGIEGVAVAVDLMLFIGIAFFLIILRRYVDYSIVSLFIVPGIIFGISIGLARLAINLPFIPRNDITTGGVKIFVFLIFYTFFIFIFEKKEWLMLRDFVREKLIRKPVVPIDTNL